MSPVSPLSTKPPEPEPPVSSLPPETGSGAGLVPLPPLPELPVPGLLSFAGGESEACEGGGVFVVSAVASVAVPDAGVGSAGFGRVGLAAFDLARAFACARAHACAISAL
jgi:hypothetical protein